MNKMKNHHESELSNFSSVLAPSPEYQHNVLPVPSPADTTQFFSRRLSIMSFFHDDFDQDFHKKRSLTK
jgi:hypothetical protein